MTYTLNYKDSFDEIKSMNTATNIDLVLGKDGLPYDFTDISNNLITVKIANQNGYIKDLPVSISNYTDEEKASGIFTLELNDDFMEEFPPDIYYLEVWINTSNNNRIIFPSNDDILPFTVNSNIVNGSDAIPMVTFYQIKQDVESTKKLVFDHEAKIEKYINSLNGKKDDVINNIDNKIQNYYKFSNNIKATLSSLNSKVFNESDDINNRINDINNNVSEATSIVNNAGKNVKNSVEGLVNSAKSNIDHDINTNSAINLITSGAENADSQIANVVNSAGNKLIGTADDLINQLNSLAQDGNKQINVTAGSITNHLEHISRNIINNENIMNKDITSTANSVSYNMDSHVASLDGNISNTTSNMDSYIASNKENYSELSNKVNHVSRTISNETSSAYSQMSNVINTNTSLAVSSAVSNFNKSTGTNDTIPKSLNNLSIADTNLLKSVNSNTNLIESYHNKYDNYYHINHDLMTNISSAVTDNRDTIDSLDSSNNYISKSLSSLTSASLVTNDNLSSTYNNCFNQAKSYTDNKIRNQSNTNNDGSKIIHDVYASNIIPFQYSHTQLAPDPDGILDINMKKGKTYWISCHVDKGDNVYFTSNGLSIDKSERTFSKGQICKCKYIPSENGPVSITSSDLYNFLACRISNFCITQSESYIPFEIAEKNRNIKLGEDQFKPNLLPVTEYEDNVNESKYRVFNIPVKKGKTYWFSHKGIEDGHLDDIRIFSPKDNDMNNCIIEDYDPKYKELCMRDTGLFIGKWVSNKDGLLPIGFSTEYYESDVHIHIKNMCITESNKYVPYMIAQQNRENIKTVFNSILNTK